jgi:hypothetical protein
MVSDATAAQFTKYWAKMPWLAIPYDNGITTHVFASISTHHSSLVTHRTSLLQSATDGKERIESLQKRFAVQGIPRLVIVNAYGKVIYIPMKYILPLPRDKLHKL